MDTARIRACLADSVMLCPIERWVAPAVFPRASWTNSAAAIATCQARPVGAARSRAVGLLRSGGRRGERGPQSLFESGAMGGSSFSVHGMSSIWAAGWYWCSRNALNPGS